ncbi:MAG: Sec-independent protein translocase subunit TatA/TatB [Thermoleophilia bacterium]
MPSVGWQELIIVLVIMLVIFGPKRLPEIGRSLGKGIKEFKKSTSEIQEQLTQEEPQVTKTEAAEPQPTVVPEAKEAPAAKTAPETTTSEPKAS